MKKTTSMAYLFPVEQGEKLIPYINTIISWSVEINTIISWSVDIIQTIMSN